MESNHSKRAIESLRSEINLALINEVFHPSVDIEDRDFPIEWETELGKFRVEENGNAFIQPKKTVQYIECKVTILPSGLTQEE